MVLSRTKVTIELNTLGAPADCQRLDGQRATVDAPVPERFDVPVKVGDRQGVLHFLRSGRRTWDGAEAFHVDSFTVTRPPGR